MELELQAAIETEAERRTIGFTRREGRRRELSRYWVHLPRFADYASAQAAHKQLSANGVKDMHVIARGNMANTLSLGVYKQRDSMERRVAKLSALGHKPVVTERFRAVKTSLLEGELDAEADFPTNALGEEFPTIKVRTGNC